MKKIGYAEDIEEYEEQLEYLEGILNSLEDAMEAYNDCHSNDNFFADEKEQLNLQILYVKQIYENLQEELDELLEDQDKQFEKELKELNAEFERSRL